MSFACWAAPPRPLRCTSSNSGTRTSINTCCAQVLSPTEAVARPLRLLTVLLLQQDTAHRTRVFAGEAQGPQSRTHELRFTACVRLKPRPRRCRTLRPAPRRTPMPIPRPRLEPRRCSARRRCSGAGCRSLLRAGFANSRARDRHRADILSFASLHFAFVFHPVIRLKFRSVLQASCLFCCCASVRQMHWLKFEMRF